MAKLFSKTQTIKDLNTSHTELLRALNIVVSIRAVIMLLPENAEGYSNIAPIKDTTKTIRKMIIKAKINLEKASKAILY